MLDRYVVFSTHARERIRECQLSMSKAAWLIYTAQPEKLPKEIKNYKKNKYSDKALHLRNGTLIFTLLPVKDKRTQDDIYLVLTIFDQRTDVRGDYGK